MKRREFLMSAAVVGSALGTAYAATAGQTASPPATEGSKGEMKYRVLGNTKERVSLLGLGGYHIGVPETEAESIKLIHAAIDGGINFLDNSWGYHRGESEVRMGKALAGGRRDKVFLMTKIDGQTKSSAIEQLDQCLQRLQVDTIDLVQHHEVIRLEDPDCIFAEGGALEALLEARQAGKLRYIGFTGHKDPLVHLRMLEVAQQHDFVFDAVQMPVNVLDAHFRSFGDKVLPELTRLGIGVLGMKSMAGGHALRTNAVSPEECLQYAMTLPTSVVISGMENMDILNKNLEVARNFEPLSEDQLAAILTRTTTFARSGKYEPFKTTRGYDATAIHPEWLG